MTVWFIDTSVLVHIVPVPGRSSHGDREKVMAEMKQRSKTRDTLILPVTAVIETGNHICHVKDGNERRQAAEKFEEIVLKVVEGKAPWQPHEATWDRAFWRRFLEGGSTGTSWIDHATQGRGGLGGGDLALVVERDLYCARTGLPREQVRIWTRDAALEARS